MSGPTDRKVAVLVRDLGWWAATGKQEASLYLLNRPVEFDHGSTKITTRYVIVSAVDHAYAHETYIFPSSEEGHPLNWLELEGSFKGGMDHAKALAGLGFELCV